MSARGLLAWTATTVLLLPACRRPPAHPEPPPVCAVMLPPRLVHEKPDGLPASIWFGLLIKDYDGRPSADAVDCSGEPIAWPPLPATCAEADDPARPVRRGAVEEDELIVRHAGGDLWFGWAPLWKLDDGTAEGPLAIAHVVRGRLEARAVGTLRGYPGRARIEVRHLGGEYVLSLEGEHCTEQGGCTRAVRLAYLDRQRFRARPLRSASVRSCLAPAWFPLHQRVVRKVDERWERSLRRELSLAYDETGVTVDERIAVHDRDLAQPSLPPRLFREAQSKLRIRVREGELIAEGQSLWGAIREEDASLRAREEVGAPTSRPHSPTATRGPSAPRRASLTR